MVFRLTLLTTALLCQLFGAPALDVCPEFPLARDTLQLVAKNASFCFKFLIPIGSAAQFIVRQPVDLSLDVQGSDIQLHVDAFDIGTETVTLPGGQFRIQIKAVDQPVPPKLIVSRKTISLQEAVKFRQAENAATESKQNLTESGIRDSFSLWRDLGDESSMARTQLKLGYYLHTKEQFEEARQVYDAVASKCEDLKDLRCQTEALNNSGVESRHLSDFDSARSTLQEAARGWELLGDPIVEARTLSNLGLLYRTTHEYRQALSFDERAAEIFEHSDRAGFARVLNDLGLCYQALAEYPRAKTYFERALRIEHSVRGEERDAVRAEINLGRTLLSIGQLVAAVSRLTQAKAVAQKLADRSALADASTNLGQALMSQGLVAKAKPLLQSALTLHQALKDRRFAAADQHLLGIVAIREGHPEEAKLRFVEAASIRAQLNLRVEAGDSFYELARIEFGAGNLEVARDLASKSLEAMESVRSGVSSPALRSSFSSARRKVFNLLIDIEVAGGGPKSPSSSFLIAEQGQGRAILDLLAESSLLTSPPSDLQEKKLLLDRRVGLISSEMLNASDKRLQTLRNQAGMLIAQRENVDAEIRDAQPERRLGHPLDSIERFQREILPHNTALLEFHLSDPESRLWLITADSLEMFRLDSQKAIERHGREFVALFGRVMDRKRSPELQRRFDDLKKQLSRELLGKLQGKKLPDTLILVCDGFLHRIPFEALSISAGEAPIGLTHNFVRVPAGGYLEAGREVRPVSEFSKAFLGFVDPVFSSDDSRLGEAAVNSKEPSLPRIPFTFELEAVNRLINQTKRATFRGFQATKSRIEDMDLANYAILHLSTHAIIDDTEPELSRVVLSLVDRRGAAIDGYLLPAQIASWRLSGSTVVLSACETALGKEVMGEGLWGLTAALFEAGAGQMVMTLSPVDAEGSSEFFTHVYRNIFGLHPADMEQSLTQARRALAASRRWSDPYYWASFVIVGRPTGRL